MRGTAGPPNPFIEASFGAVGANGLKGVVDGAPNGEAVAAGGVLNEYSFLSAA